MDYLQYVDMDSFLHRLDPRTKFAFFVAIAILTSVVKSLVALSFLLVFFLVLWCCCHIGKYIAGLLGKLKVLLIFITLLWFVLGLFERPPVEGGPIFYETVFPLFGSEHTFCFDWYDFYKGITYVVRIFLMVSAFYTVLLTTNFSEIILGLRKWHLPYAVAFAIGLVFQIIPLIINELQAIMDAQSSRGLEIEDCGWATKIKNYITFSLPLLFRVIGKAHAISVAMHFYKLDFAKQRTSYKLIRATWRDTVFISCSVVAIAVTVLLRILFYIPV